MNSKLATLASVLALVAAAPACATIYDFTADLTGGNNTGVLTGTIDLSFVGPGGSGTGAASDVTITGLPAGIPLPEGPDATSWTNQIANSFTVVGGVITDFSFDAVTGADGLSDIELCFNIDATVSGGSRVCPTDLNFIGDGHTTFGDNIGGATGITFTAVGTPEPGSWAMMLCGFAGLGAALRSRRKLAAI